MRLAAIQQDGTETAAVITPGGALPASTIDAGWKGDLLTLIENGKLTDISAWHETGNIEGFASDILPFDRISYAPLYRRPRKVWGIGLNYTEHASDLSETAPAEEPASFLRPDTAIIGPGDEIRLPSQSNRVTGEAELGVIIGRECKDVSEEEAPSVVAGFTTILDMTAEDILRKNPRYLTRAKSFDTFFSFGPHLVTPDEFEEVENLEVATVLNGEVRRVNTVSNMTFPPWRLVAFHSRVMTLLPGDIISTGTPGAVGIRGGDTLGCRISGFASLSNPVVG